MRRSLAGRTVLAAATASAAIANAGDWTVTGFASQRFEANDGEGSDTLRSVSDIGVNARTATPRSRLSFAPGLRLSATNGDEGFDALPRLNAQGLFQNDPRTTLTGSASLVPQFVDDAQFEQGDSAQGSEGVQLNGTLAAGVQHTLNSTDRLSFGADARATTVISGEGLDDTQRFGLNTGFTRQVTPLTGLSLTPSASFFSGGSGGDGYSLSVRTGVQVTPTPRHRASFSLGPSATYRDEDGEFTPGVVGGASLTYQGRETTLSAGFNQDVDNSATRGLDTVSSFNGGVSHRLTSWSRVSLNGSASVRTPLDGDGDNRITFSLSPSYAVDLTEDWSLSVGYQMRAVRGDDLEDDDEALRNTVFLSLSRGLSLLP